MYELDEAVSKLGLRLPSQLAQVTDRLLEDRDVELYLKREDLIHADMPGNKWRKLKYNISAAKQQGATTLLTFGGAYSNHIRAVAAAASHFGFDSIGVIRGEPHDPLNDQLSFARRRGMELTYLDRRTYREKYSADVLGQLRSMFGDFFLIPEGGSNVHALRGCAELVAEIDLDFDLICCPCGTGGTLAGIAGALGPDQRALGFSALKGGGFLNKDVRGLQEAALGNVTSNWSIAESFHFGGFAKKNDELIEFIVQFERDHAIQLDRVYVAKMMYGIYSMIENKEFEAGCTIVALVTG